MPVKLAVLVLAHKNAPQTKLLIQELLNYPLAQVFIHIDLKSDELFQDVTSAFSSEPRVHIITERYSVDWGSYHQILATFALTKAAQRSGADYFSLISGQDFPIKRLEELAAFFEKNRGKQYLVHFRLPDAQWEFGGLKRIEWFHLPGEKRNRLVGHMNGLIHRIQKLFRYNRKVEGVFYGGSNWFNLSSDAVQWVCNYIEQHPQYLKQFRWTRCADELFIQTLVMRSPYAEQTISQDLRFVDWSSGPEYPRTFRAEDLERLMQQEDRFFARKFDSDIDTSILALISERLKK